MVRCADRYNVALVNGVHGFSRIYVKV